MANRYDPRKYADNRPESQWRTHPRTGRVYRFPRDAKRYHSLMYRRSGSRTAADNEFHCEYGHMGCAAWDGGPCWNEHCFILVADEC